eukprot:GILI01011148.1.p1 GENE.GILI01011148.1~~GILI01011148.1.p1  ORF type:complete len:321 (+),score=29.82 GILI01011148.1:69-1031(+)
MPYEQEEEMQQHTSNASPTYGSSQHKVKGRPPFGEPILTLRHVKKSFPINKGKEIVTALHDITLDSENPNAFPSVRQGEFVIIRGPSGGGKTTLLNIIGTIDSLTSGELEMLGSTINGKSDDNFLADLRLQHIGFVFQTFNLIATMTACENVELPMTLLGALSEKERKRRAKQLLSLVGLRNRIDHLPSELSGGEQQRVTIARALANNPAMLLLDEPTGDLDTATTIEVMDLLLRLNHMAGTTCIMVTHNPDIECYADRILYVADGRFAMQAINETPQELVYEKYQQYLNERDQKMTVVTEPAPLAQQPLHNTGIVFSEE